MIYYSLEAGTMKLLHWGGALLALALTGEMTREHAWPSLGSLIVSFFELNKLILFTAEKNPSIAFTYWWLLSPEGAALLLIGFFLAGQFQTIVQKLRKLPAFVSRDNYVSTEWERPKDSDDDLL